MLRLAEIRKSKKLSQLTLGNKIGVAQETISGYEIGRAEPDLATLCKLADTLCVSVDYLLGRSDEKLPPPSQLSSVELEMLQLLRSLPAHKKERALGFLEGLESMEVDSN